MDPGDADREELAERVEQLEQTVSKMLPDRRGVLKGLGAAAVGGAAVGASSGGASGQSGAAGSQGTPESPNNMYAYDLDVQNGATFNGTDIEDVGSVSADVSNDELRVPTDSYQTIQSAHDALPAEGGVIRLVDIVSETEPTLTKPVRLIGGGMGYPTNQSSTLPRIYLDHSGGNGLNVDGDGVVVEGLAVVGDSTNGEYGVRVGESGARVQCRSFESGGDGWLIQGSHQNSRFDAVSQRAEGHGIHIDVTEGYFNGNTFDSVMSNSSTGNGLFLDGPNSIKGNQFNGVVIEENDGDGIKSNDDTEHIDNVFIGYGVEGPGNIDISTEDNQILTRRNNNDNYLNADVMFIRRYLNLEDDTPARFGADNDFQIRYDSGGDRLEILEGGFGPIAAIESGGDLTLLGTVTENGSL